MPRMTDHNREYVNQLLTKALQSSMAKHGFTELSESLRYGLAQMANVSINPEGYTVMPEGWLEHLDYGFSVAVFDDMLRTYKTVYLQGRTV